MMYCKSWYAHYLSIPLYFFFSSIYYILAKGGRQKLNRVIPIIIEDPIIDKESKMLDIDEIEVMTIKLDLINSNFFLKIYLKKGLIELINTNWGSNSFIGKILFESITINNYNIDTFILGLIASDRYDKMIKREGTNKVTYRINYESKEKVNETRFYAKNNEVTIKL